MARQSVVDTLVENIRERIKEGGLVPGQRLIEPDLMSTFGVSRTALREAFRRLAAEGLVDIELHRGASVRRFTKADIQETFLIRELLEGLAVRQATRNLRDGSARDRLLKAQARMQAAAKSMDAAAYAEANTAFHDLLIEIADSPQLARLLTQLSLPVLRLIYSRLLRSEPRENSLREHEAIIAAMLAGDAAAAEESMRKHVRSSGAAVMDLMEAAEAQSHGV